jgi:hypothetical protein
MPRPMFAFRRFYSAGPLCLRGPGRYLRQARLLQWRACLLTRKGLVGQCSRPDLQSGANLASNRWTGRPRDEVALGEVRAIRPRLGQLPLRLDASTMVSTLRPRPSLGPGCGSLETRWCWRQRRRVLRKGRDGRLEGAEDVVERQAGLDAERDDCSFLQRGEHGALALSRTHGRSSTPSLLGFTPRLRTDAAIDSSESRAPTPGTAARARLQGRTPPELKVFSPETDKRREA